ncbi:MAG: Dabb family protein [Saprospiraceae bacterium]|nr:Dabb family protein [Saprospiraceae bacterium]MDG2419762.1 Dabb family protein [Saprospiraceae bacterium]
MKNIIYLSLVTIFLMSCNNPNPRIEKELSEIKTRLIVALAALEGKNPPKNLIVHEVYFNLKDDLTSFQKEKFFQDILTLKDIPVIQNLIIGDFKDLDDPRALSEYEIKMSMEFQSKKEYIEYQEHPIHLSLKKIASNIIAAPPATYDFIRK